jgi:tetratricopeptide (TPR) repeat protein
LAKPPTEWERVRQQLRGEKSDSSSPKPKAKEPSVADLVLEALAKNGQHLSLGDKESLTVSVVFRAEEQPESAQTLNFNSFNDGVSNVTNVITDESASTPDKQPSPDDKKPASGGTPGDATDKGSSPRDYELLGDLHRKQGQSKEALKAYQKAVEKNADAQHAAAMYLKIAQLYLTAENNEAEARKAIDQARELLAKTGADKKQTPKPKKAESPLPSRLIITVSKELLDRAGTGIAGTAQISLEEFKKAATVEYLPFASR